MPVTRLARLCRPGALLTVMAAALLAGLLLVSAAHYRPPPGPEGPEKGDAATYERIIERMHAGESYYFVAHQELVAGGYGTRSVFNWRTPLYPSFMALLPAWNWARWPMMALAFVAGLTIVFAVLEQAGLGIAVVLVPVLGLSLAASVASSLALFSELPCGLLLLLAVGLSALGWRYTAVAGALLALFVRELAAPFVLVMAAQAAFERRRGEVAVWVLGLIAYAGYFAWHAYMVGSLIGPADRAYASGWMQFGGLGFILATAQANGVFWLAPIWITAVVLPLALIGLAAWPGRTGTLVLASVATYLALFAVFGKPFNTYWGLVYTPLLAPGLAWAPFAFVDMARAFAGPARRVESA